MYSKSKPYQPIKVEKENENVQLRKKIKNSTADKLLTKKKETVWDRLSKTKKVPSSENLLAARSRPSLTTKYPQRFQSFRHSSFKQSITPTCSTTSKRSNAPQKHFPNEPNLKDLDNLRYLHALPIEDYLSGRSSSKNSKSSSEEAIEFFKLSNDSLCFKGQIENDFSEDSDDVYTLAPLLSSCSEDNIETCRRTLKNAPEFLWHNQSIALHDAELRRACIKSDNGYENLEKNPKILRNFLKTQLQNILTQEFAVKKALGKLESSENLEQSVKIQSPELRNKIVSFSGHDEKIQKFEVDVLFKNVPSLDKEIEILRSLGEKLETTLKFTASHRKKRDAISQISARPSTQSLLVAKEKHPTKIFKLKYEVYDAIVESHAQVSLHIIGICYCVGIVNEFYMSQKSIFELKRESNHSFYIRDDSESNQLIRTSFEKLKENPNELLRHVKPKNPQVTFNVLEQDPAFFYNAFKKLSIIPYLLSTNQEKCEEYQYPIKQNIFYESGEKIFWNASIQDTPPNYKNMLLDEKECASFESECNRANKLPNAPTISEPPIRGKERRRIRRCVTPMRMDYNFYKKKSFFKTILVGFVQMTVFIVFIMALTYPDVRC